MTSTDGIPFGDEDWASLVIAIQSGNCVLMLGPNSVTEGVDDEGTRRPLVSCLADYLAERLGDPSLRGARLLQVGQAVRTRKDPNTLLFWTQEFYRERPIADPAIEALLSLPFPVVLNAVAGAPIEAAFPEGRDHATAYYDYTGGAQPATPTGTRDVPLVYHLLGSVGQLSSLVVSESALLDFLVAAVSETPALPANLAGVLRSRKTSFLSLGFELHQWQFRVFTHALFVKEGRDNRSFALEDVDSPTAFESGHFYWQDHKVEFFDMDLAAFATELAERVGPVAAGSPAASGPAPDAPVVFLCHASEDKPSAERLADDLRSNGIKVWFDRDSLRGGDRWDSAIRTAIDDESDYFVVLQSAELKAKDVGYVNKEINLALNRHLDFRPPRIFMIPVVIDGDQNRLGHLDHIQSIDLNDWDRGVEAVVSAIRRDLQRASSAR